ncbi:Leucine_carboxyl methyltransferase [Hexamita inflata]|uniref:Leucine carboxyl methyltransferase 1 n=1 Tax=Hexamita inflata TaxID=28002 RepID=A0AA86Q3M6_9EUKA|nr:Leucine carboxyl methyltransferase [Hexamita inflata]
MSFKETARETAFDAISSKSSALKKGYFKDDMMHLVSKPHPQSKDPMINRGTWFRIELFQQFCTKFLEIPNSQILVLGAGLDTLFYRLNVTNLFYEVDLPEICQTKAHKLGFTKQNDETYVIPNHPNYKLVSADLEDDFLGKLGIDQALPTLVISDVVLSYLESDSTVELVEKLGNYFSDLTLLFFEMINPHDAFGDTMIYNMSLRNVFMPTFAEIGYLENYQRQMKNIGCQTFKQNAWTCYNKWPGRSEIEKLEWLDEYEQFQLIMEHYGVMAGSNKSGINVLTTIFEGIGQIQ